MGAGYSGRNSYMSPGRRDYNHPRYRPRSYESNDVRDPDTETDDVVIKVISIDMRIKENGYDHHTLKFHDRGPSETERKLGLVVRRGQPFDIEITFNRQFNKEKDDIRFRLEFGNKPQSNNATQIEIIMSDKDEPKSWGASIRGSNDEKLKVRIKTPPTLYVGKWKFNVDVIKREDEEDKTVVYRHKKSQEIYILFNPWCKDDDVHLDDDKLLDEYVLNQTGKIYKGNHSRIRWKAWNFAQFEPPVLECVIWLLESKSGLQDRERGNPVLVSRKLSALVNSSDQGGVLTGKWGGGYSGGTRPTLWNGSINIIKEYDKYKKPVKYGQCWVFAGVLNTMCRALGIPARCVTNFASAHDTDGNVTIERYLMKGENLGSDSVWNFHVWNDEWIMKRPDLPNGYGGWQAIDATPQETSEGLYQCGPMPLKAIHEGYVDLPYDGPFIYAEVNADRITYELDKNYRIKSMEVEEDSVGKKLSTKKPNSNYREDVTDQYKYPEGSKAERKSVITANKKGAEYLELINSGEKAVKIEFITDEKVIYGDDFDVTVVVRNKSGEEKVLFGSVFVYTTDYIVHESKEVLERNETLQIAAGQSKDFVINVKFDDYYPKLFDGCMFKLIGSFDDELSVWRGEDDFNLKKPELDIKVIPEEIKEGEKAVVEISFTNPLRKKLTLCDLEWQIPGLGYDVKKRVSDVDKEFIEKIEIEARRLGEKTITANFDAKEIFEVDGIVNFNVVPS